MSRIFLLLILGFFAFGLVPQLEAKTAKYVGVKKCATCHKKKKQGKQLAIWKKSKHSKTFQVLASKKAKTRAAKMGVSGNPQQAEACLVCHTTSVGIEKSQMGKRFKIENGVQCETCHGAGSLYRKKKVMKAIFKERGLARKGDSPTAKKTGMLIASKNTCKRCHVKEIQVNVKTFKNPSFKPFNFKKRWKKIAHPVPARKG